MAGGYVLCEWKSVQKEFPNFQRAFAKLETELITKCEAEWSPKRCGYLTPGPGEFGRTTILPGLFWNHNGINFQHSWRQLLTTTGNQLLISGNPANGWVIGEDYKVAWIGLAFPNKMQHVTEFRFQIGDKKYGRYNIQDLEAYNFPALVFEEGFIIDEEQSFDLWGYVDQAPTIGCANNLPGNYQSVVMLGALYYRIVDKLLGNTGTQLPIT